MINNIVTLHLVLTLNIVFAQENKYNGSKIPIQANFTKHKHYKKK